MKSPVRFAPAAFLRDENAAVTVDWVVLTAAVVAFATTVAAILNGSIARNVTTKLETIISDAVDGVGRGGDD
ncbi:hypothetical protein [Pseudogemmobacter humi]|uniref:Uncharacterized protein n=1 Tax=Pseudogemmobacter humi TaxID=2483812 RepID=A0A3P5WYU8_9RHOB|nr:hypothetical protein [Pseudogemmobacter humi]VDC21157.1 hypothetical protein XINFAN_00521 [Pseudogemmobacter humi]